MDQQRIVDLPLNGRDITQLMSMQAGVIPQAQSFSEGNAFVVNGIARQNGVSYMLDGGMNTDSYRNYSGLFPNPDAHPGVQRPNQQLQRGIRERYGSGGERQSHKSGTNQFHGTAFEFLRNGTSQCAQLLRPERDSLKRNQFGGTLGGPIVHDKLFFFFSYQGTTLRTDPQLTRQVLPTAAMRAGDFSGFAPILDPLTGEQFPGNQIRADRLNPVTQAFLKYLPVPATADGSRFTGFPSNHDTIEYTAKVDWNLQHHRVTGRTFTPSLPVPSRRPERLCHYVHVRCSAQPMQPYSQWTVNDI